MLTLKEKLVNIALIVGAFVAAGSIAPNKAKAIPIETSNSPIFGQDWTGSVGADINSNRAATSTRKYDPNKDNLLASDGKTKLTIRPDGVLVYKDTHRPYVGIDEKENYVIKRLIDGQYRNVLLTKHEVVYTPNVGITDVHPAGGLVTSIANDLLGSCNGGQLVGQNCQTRSTYNDITAYGQGAVRTGGNTAILGGYDSNSQTVYGAGAVKLDNLALTAGADRFGPTGSAAYSIGAVSPFIAYQRGLTNYGADFRLSDNLSLNAAYRSDNSYFLGARIDVGGNLDQPVAQVAATPVAPVNAPPPPPLKQDFVCGAGYRKFEGTCVRLIQPPQRAPKNYINRARG